MKKHVFLLISVLVISCATLCYAANIDLSGMSFDELVELQSEVNKALWASDGWKKVEVPVGTYEVGSEIPAGKYTVRRYEDDDDDYQYFAVGTRIEKGEVNGYTITSDLEHPLNVILEEGTYIVISHKPAIFTPYVVTFTFE